MASDYRIPPVTRAPDVARAQRVQEVRAESGQQGLRAHLREESEKPLKHVSSSPQAHSGGVGSRDGQGGSKEGDEDTRDGTRQRAGPEEKGKGDIIDVLC